MHTYKESNRLVHNKSNTKVQHRAADDTNLRISTSYKKLQKELNKDLKNLNQWLLANKISLNNTKTEIIHFHN